MCAIELRCRYRGKVETIGTFPADEANYFSLDGTDENTVRMFRIIVSPDEQTAFVEGADDVPLALTGDPTRAERIIYEYKGVVGPDRPYVVPLIEGVKDSPSVSVEYSSPDEVPTNVA